MTWTMVLLLFPPLRTQYFNVLRTEMYISNRNKINETFLKISPHLRSREVNRDYRLQTSVHLYDYIPNSNFHLRKEYIRILTAHNYKKKHRDMFTTLVNYNYGATIF